MNKNEHTAMMYESIPAVAELNKVPGFNPLKLLRRVISPDNGETVLQLDLPYKKLWFRLANPKGRIRLNALRITEQMAIYEAQVFLERTDENPIGSFTSSCTKEEAPGGHYIQAAQQAAMDEALSDAGFGIQFADVGMGAEGSRYGSRVPLNGTASNKNTAIPAGTGAVSAERVQPSAASAGDKVKTFPATAGTSVQEKPAQQSVLPVQGKMTAADTGIDANLPLGVEQKVEKQLSAISSGITKAGQTAETVQAARVQPQTGNSSLLAEPQAEVRNTAQSAQTGELPVKAAEAESLPVQTNMGLPASETAGNTLPISEKKSMDEDTRKAVQGMMALLGGQDISPKTTAVSTGTAANVEHVQTKAPVSSVQNLPAGVGTASEVQNLPVAGGTVSEAQNLPVAGGTVSEAQNLPVAGSTVSGTQNLPAAENPAQEKEDARYTPDMPVEEIVRLMTFEEAGQVIVDAGVFKGQTLAEVAERRPPSLKFYVYGAYRGDNNILRAAARIMLDSLEAKKAG